MACRLKKEYSQPIDLMVCSGCKTGWCLGCVPEEPEVMCPQVTRQQFFRMGKLCMYTFVSAARLSLTWTPEIRATWIKHYTAERLRTRHIDPTDLLSSYYAGAVSALKSGRAAHFEDAHEQEPLFVFLTLPCRKQPELHQEYAGAQTEVCLPLSVTLGFFLLNLVSHVSTSGIIAESIIVAAVVILRRHILQALFFLSDLAREEE